jgi:hypothetical protein
VISVKIGSVSLQRVKEVQKSASFTRDAYVTAGGAGVQQNTWDIRGFIFGSGTDFFVQQKAFEDALAATGESDITIGNLTPFLGRVTEVTWEPYHTGPMLFYTVKVAPLAKSNPFAGIVQLGSLLLNNPVPSVTEQYKTVSEDERMSPVASRAFRIQGRFMGTPGAVQAFLDSLEAEITGSPDGFFALTTPMGAYTARCREAGVERPEQTDTGKAVTYSLNVETRPDYSLETYSLPHQAINVAGVGFDVLNSLSHSIDRVQKGTGPFYKITGESLTWSAKKYFDSVASADAYKPAFEALVTTRHTITSPTGAILECKSVSYNVVTRDGHFEDGSRRYAITASLTFSKPQSQRENPGGVAFGVVFDTISSDNRGVTVDENGGITSRTRNVAGKVVGSLPTNLIGSACSESDGTYYITGINVGGLDDEDRYEVSISGRTLDNETQGTFLIDEIFEGVHLKDVTSKSRSVSQSFNDTSKVFETSSLTDSISGYLWGQDAQGVLDLVTIISVFYEQPKVTSASISRKEAFTRPDTKEHTFRQSVSLTRIVNYKVTEPPPDDGSGDTTDTPPQFDPLQPDKKIEETTQFGEQTDRFSPITIPGGEIVFKKVGINPSTAKARVSWTAKNFKVYNSMGEPGKPGVPANVPDPQETSDEKGEGGLTRWHETAWQAGQAK